MNTEFALIITMKLQLETVWRDVNWTAGLAWMF